jgi:hypothetical protein
VDAADNLDFAIVKASTPRLVTIRRRRAFVQPRVAGSALHRQNSGSHHAARRPPRADNLSLEPVHPGFVLTAADRGPCAVPRRPRRQRRCIPGRDRPVAAISVTVPGRVTRLLSAAVQTPRRPAKRGRGQHPLGAGCRYIDQCPSIRLILLRQPRDRFAVLDPPPAFPPSGPGGVGIPRRCRSPNGVAASYRGSRSAIR